MKKLFRKMTALFMTLCLIAGMTGLPAAYAAELDDAAIVAADKDAVAIGLADGDSTDGVTDNLTLPMTGVSGSAITWLSDTPEIIANDGIVTRPADDAHDAEVTLTATITYGEAFDTREFTMTVLKEQTEDIGEGTDKNSYEESLSGDNGEGRMFILGGMESEITWEGIGNSEDPFKVSSAEHLADITNQGLDKHYIQTADIDLSGYARWIPIGDASTPFKGTYNGNGKTISNLTINDGTLEYVGLFGCLGEGGRLEEITLTGVSVTSTKDAVWTEEPRNDHYEGIVYVGGLVGAIDKGTVTGCSSTGSVTAGTAAKVGGLVGINAHNYTTGTITDCSSAGIVTAGDDAAVGGLVGDNAGTNVSSGTIDRSQSSATVTGGDNVNGDFGFDYRMAVGGLVGDNAGNTRGSHNTGDVSGGINAYIGGLVGYHSGHENTEIKDSSSTGKITGGTGSTIGALIGYMNGGDILLNSISINTPANKLSYTVGDTLDISGLVVTGNYTNNNTALLPITTSDITGFDSSEPTEGQVLTISYESKETTYTVNIEPLAWQAGSGTAEDPYEVATAMELDNVRNYPDKHFIQTADIALTDDKNWVPIGHDEVENNPFTGVYDGGGYSITNLTIISDDDSLSCIGLFSEVGRGGKLININLTDVNINSNSSEQYTRISGLAGINEGSIIKCSVSGSVTGGETVYLDYAGGLVGENYGTVSMCSSTAIVSGGKRAIAGGLVGNNGYEGVVEYSYSIGDVRVGDGSGSAGGLVGYSTAIINNCYSTATAGGGTEAKVGGLVGEVYGGEISFCYSAGTITGGYELWYRDGLVGYKQNNPTDSSNYFLKLSDYGGEMGDPKPAAELKQEATFVGWDFTNVWSIDEGDAYPLLTWQDSFSPHQAIFYACGVLNWDVIRGMNIDKARVTNDLVLPKTGEFGTTISWSASPEGWINTNTGEVISPGLETGEIAITLTAFVGKDGGATKEKVFPLVLTVQNIEWKGNGTQESPWLVETAAHLNDVRNKTMEMYMSGKVPYFEQVADIDLSSYNNWKPIGYEEEFEPFYGTYDGRGYTISNMAINNQDTEMTYVGLFYILGAESDIKGQLKNIRLENVRITTDFEYKLGALEYPSAGGLVGISQGIIENVSGDVLINATNLPSGLSQLGGLVGHNIGNVINCSAVSTINGQGPSAGSLSGSFYVGGLVGYNEGLVQNSYSQGSITLLEEYIVCGGLIGDNDGSVSKCGSSANVSGSGTYTVYVGGLIGWNDSVFSVEECYSTGDIGGEGGFVGAGGLAGYHYGVLGNCYSTGDVYGSKYEYAEFVELYVGGLAAEGYGSIDKCYSTGKPSASLDGEDGDIHIGGLVGDTDVSNSSSYYDKETSAQNDDDTDKGNPKTTAEMKQQATYVDWDFTPDTGVWIIDGVNYPELQWKWKLDQAVAADKAELTWDNIKGSNTNHNNITANLALAKSGANGSTITWSVNPTGWINPTTGAVTRPSSSEGDNPVTLTATIINGPASDTVSFYLIVKAMAAPGGGRKPAPTPTVDSSGNITTTPKLNKNTGVAATDIDNATLTAALEKAVQDSEGKKTVEILIPAVEGAKAYESTLPASALTSVETGTQLEIKTGIATVTLPGNMLGQEAAAEAQSVSLSIAQADVSDIEDEEIRSLIGDRPLIQLSLEVDGSPYAWSNENAPVIVSIPYTPTEAELADPEHIVVWYIDGSGNVTSVPNGRYDAATGTVTFSTTHFSYYAVAYVHKTFSDLGSVGWARKPIEAMASKGIINGTGAGTFSPQVSITRADYLVLLIKTLGLTAEFADNFNDVEQGSYYYEAIGVAKKLGIAAGGGNNRFNPGEPISREDMMTLTARAMEKYKGLQAAGDTAFLDKFIDKGDIAEYAVGSMTTMVKEGLIVGSENKLNPRANTTRAEASVFLYRIYNSYTKPYGVPTK